MKSFTLIEILVVISIVLILTIFVVPNFHLADSRIALERAAYKMAQQIRNVEEMAMSSKGTPASTFVSSLFPLGGYGLYFKASADSDSYIIFADCNDDGKYDEGGSVFSDCAHSGNGNNAYPEKVSDIFLDSGIKIKKNQGSQLDSITFIPPDPEVKMQPASPGSPKVTLFSTREVDRCVAVYMNAVGNVEIKNEPCN